MKSTFSNGFTDTYKGKRPVTVGWAIIDRLTGQTIASGHSLDCVKAQKTAENNLRHYVQLEGSDIDLPKRGDHPNWTERQIRKPLIEAGYEAKNLAGDYGLRSAAVEHAAKRKAARMAKVTIEIVEIKGDD